MGSSPHTAEDVLGLIESEGYEFVDLRFVDLVTNADRPAPVRLAQPDDQPGISHKDG